MVGIAFTGLMISGGAGQTPGAVLRSILNLGMTLVPSILGFLIAGFTVFVTITRPGVFSQMAKMEFGGTGQSYLKHNLSAFMLAFAHYVCYLSINVLIAFFGQPNGLVVQMLKSIGSIFQVGSIDGYVAIASIAVVAFSCWTWYLVMLLKSFIYNVYQVVVTSVRWDLEMEVATARKLRHRKLLSAQPNMAGGRRLPRGGVSRAN